MATDFLSRASQIYAKINRETHPVAVFRMGDKCRTCRYGSDLFRRAEREKSYLVGVYDRRCLLEWLEDDLQYACRKGNALAHAD